MERAIYKALIDWKSNPNKKPLLVRGARQVGKTYTISEFAKKEYPSWVYLNFEQNPDLGAFFESELNPETIVENISLYFDIKIHPQTTLLFFDEIQEAPRAITSLKYFYEKAPGYNVIAAGSLLGVSVGKDHSFPVGKVNFLDMYPLSFSEFLAALGQNSLASLINDKMPDKLPGPFHNKLIAHLKTYLFTGGMPEVVNEFSQTRDYQHVRQIQMELLEAYENDFSKYSSKDQAVKTLEVWKSIPRQLSRENKKFKYGEVRKKARSSYYAATIFWLEGAGLIYRANNLNTAKLPLSGYADYTKFKTYMFDTGLLGAMLRIPPKTIIDNQALFTEYNGAVMENYVAGELVKSGIKELFYWTSKSDAEVDFIIQTGTHIIPLEVKSGTSRNIKSLRSYASKYSPSLIVRTSPRNFEKREDFINIPLYLIGAKNRIKGLLRS